MERTLLQKESSCKNWQHIINKYICFDIFLILQFMFFVVCAENYYQTSAATDDTSLVCTPCPPGITNNAGTNDDACGQCT